MTVYKSFLSIFCVSMFSLVGLQSCRPQGTGSLTGTLQVANCKALEQGRVWSLDVRFVNVQFLGESNRPVSAELRLQTYPGTLTQHDTPVQDLLIISIKNPQNIKDNQTIPIVAYEAKLTAEPLRSDPSKPEGRAIFALGKTCPTLSHPTSFRLEGQLTFTKFSMQKSAPIEGTLSIQVGPARASSAKSKGRLNGTFQTTYDPFDELGHEYVGYRPSSP